LAMATLEAPAAMPRRVPGIFVSQIPSRGVNIVKSPMERRPVMDHSHEMGGWDE